MLDPLICPACCDRADAPLVQDERLVCRPCGHRWEFRRLPLFALTGPSGGGKSSVGADLARDLGERVVVLEQDVLWAGGLRDDEDGHPLFRRTWLRLAAMIHQAGRPVVLCGTVVPAELEPLPERALFDRIHYLALVAEPETLSKRLRARPKWRRWDDAARIAEMLAFAAWLRADAARMDPPVRLFDTTHAPLEAAVRAASNWIRGGLPAS